MGMLTLIRDVNGDKAILTAIACFVPILPI